MLNDVLDCGIAEKDFWEMTPGEIARLIESRNRTRRIAAQEQASRDYTLATLIVRGIGITLGDKTPFPTRQEVYPGLFDDVIQQQEDKIQERKNELSALRFKQFAQSYNDKFKNKEVPK